MTGLRTGLATESAPAAFSISAPFVPSCARPLDGLTGTLYHNGRPLRLSFTTRVLGRMHVMGLILLLPAIGVDRLGGLTFKRLQRQKFLNAF